MTALVARMALLALLLPVAACAPWPHVEHTRPKIVGRLVEAGKPMPGVELFLGAKPGLNEPCEELGEQLPVSAVDGSFQLAERSSLVLVQSLLNPPSQTSQITAICIRRPQRGAEIGALLVHFVNKPASVSVTCDVSRTRERGDMGNAQVSSPLGQPQLCRAVHVSQ